MAIAVAFIASPGAAAAVRFSGTVDAAATYYKAHNLNVSGPRTIDLTLNWSNVKANLNLVLKNPAGTVVARTTSTTARPEVIRYSYTGAAGGVWKVAVLARTGKSAYTVDVADVAQPPPNKAPVARSDSARTPINSPVDIPVLANDVDADGPSPLTVSALTAPTNGGSVAPSIASPSAVTYTPPTDYHGTTTFSYKACDSAPTPACSPATAVSVQVGDPPPVAAPDVTWTRAEKPVVVLPLANDTSFSGPLYVESLSAAANGAAEIDQDAATSVTYTPSLGFVGEDVFEYVACDRATPQQCAAPRSIVVKVVDADTWAGDVGVWAAENEASRHDWTLEEAVAHARTFDALLTNPKADPPTTYNDYYAQMKEASPSTLLVGYLNGTKSRIATDTEAPWPDPSYLYASDGSRVVQPYWGNFLMSPFDATWRSSRPPECTGLIGLGLDTCYIDALAAWALTNNSSWPIHPSTGSPVTSQEWLAATTEIARDINAALPAETVLWGSGGVNGLRHFGSATEPPERQLLDGLDATVHEAFCRRPGLAATTFPGEAAWKLDIEMIRDVESRGQYMLPLTKVFVQATEQQQQSIMKYCLGSFLLGTDGSSLFGFQRAKGAAMEYDPLWDVVLGPPHGPYADYAKTGGVYQRTFTNGRVIVNPTAVSATVQLGAAYKRPDGATVTSLTLQPRTAEILTTLA